MNATKAQFAPVPSVIEAMAAAAPGGQPVAQSAAQPVSQEEQVAADPQAAAVPAAALKLPVREATQTMSLKVPKSLYDELRNFMKMTDIPMSEILVEGARKELAHQKKKYGIGGE